MIASYHNHTNFSDGKNTHEEMRAGAIALGVEELGFSDHYVLHPTGATPVWAMDPGRLDEYVTEVGLLVSEDGPTILLGLEVDWFPGLEEVLGEKLGRLNLDYLIGSVHEVDGFPIDYKPEPWDALDQDERNAVHRGYWRAMAEMARSRLFDIAAHIDLTKKFGHEPTVDLTAEIDAALDAIAEADMVVELNTAGWHKPCGDGYPSEELCAKCFARGIPVTINADAHRPEHLTRDFARAAQRLKSAGYAEVARFAQRGRWMEPIDAAVPPGG
jgi:histidinol-phosphatase (PHP family)